MYGRQTVAALLVLLLAFPAWATSSENNVIGNVSSSELATLRGAILATGSTILSGDVIQVNPAGLALISIAGGSQVQIGANSQVEFAKDNQRVEFGLDRGIVMFRSVEGSPVVAHLADATIQAVGGPAVGVLEIRSPSSVLIAATKGSLEVRTAHDNNAVTLHEGEAATVPMAPDADQRRETRGAGHWGKGHILLLAGFLAVTVTAIGIALSEMEKHQPTQQKCNKISPVTCP